MQRVSMAALVGAAIIFMAGLFTTLLGFRLTGRFAEPDPLQEKRRGRSRRLLRVFGPALMLFAVGLLFVEPPAQPREWQTVTTSDGVCSIEMPGSPTESEGPTVKELGKPETQQRLVQDNGSVQYSLSYSEISAAYRDMPAEELLEMIGKNWLLAARHLGKPQLIGEENLSENGWPGKEITIDIADQRMRHKWFVVNKRLYRAIVSTPRDDQHLEDAGRFMESFRILKKPDADKES